MTNQEYTLNVPSGCPTNGVHLLYLSVTRQFTTTSGGTNAVAELSSSILDNLVKEDESVIDQRIQEVFSQINEA